MRECLQDRKLRWFGHQWKGLLDLVNAVTLSLAVVSLEEGQGKYEMR